MRPFNCFLITMCAIVGIMVDQGVDTFKHYPSLIMIFIGGWALSASAMVLNDYFDIEVDKINDPSRPIPSGEIKPKQALRFGVILIVIGLLMAIGIDTYEWIVWKSQFGVSIVTSIICAIMVSTYTTYMKRYSILGNLAVSVGVWMGFLYGDLVLGLSINPLPECMAFAAFMLNFGREVMKGIIDIEGDRANGVTTIATALGVKWTAIIAASLWVLTIGGSILPLFIAGASIVYISTISVIIALALTSAIWYYPINELLLFEKLKQ